MRKEHLMPSWVTMHNNGINAAPPTARFQMVHQPQRPGYAERL